MRHVWFVLLAACGSDPKSPVDAAQPDAEGTATLGISPLALDFGTVPVGNASALIPVTISSLGATAVGLAIAIDDARFVRHATTCTDFLAAGATCTIGVTFAPVAVNTAQGHLTAMAMNAATVSISLLGQAINGDDILTIQPASHDFGSVAITQTASQTFTINNVGGTPRGPLGLVLGGTDPSQFAIANDTCTNQTLAAAATCTFDAVFAPTALAAKTAMVSVTGGTPLAVALSGDGVAPPP